MSRRAVACLEKVFIDEHRLALLGENQDEVTRYRRPARGATSEITCRRGPALETAIRM